MRAFVAILLRAGFCHRLGGHPVSGAARAAVGGDAGAAGGLPARSRRRPGVQARRSCCPSSVRSRRRVIASAIYDDNNGHETELLWILETSALLGPSLGHWYAGKVVTPGLGVRAVGFAVGAAAFGSDDLDTARWGC